MLLSHAPDAGTGGTPAAAPGGLRGRTEKGRVSFLSPMLNLLYFLFVGPIAGGKGGDDSEQAPPHLHLSLKGARGLSRADALAVVPAGLPVAPNHKLATQSCPPLPQAAL